MFWKVNTVDLIHETIEHNSNTWILRIPFMIFKNILAEVAERAIKIDDPELNILMLRLGLYEVHPQDIENAISGQKAQLTA